MINWFLAFYFTCFSSLGFSSELKTKFLTELERVEPWDTHLVYADHVWEGKVAVGAVKSSRIEVYNTDGNLEQTIEMPFTPQKLFPYGKDGILVTGVTSNPIWQSYYAEITKQNGRYALTKSYQFPNQMMTDYFAEHGSVKYFTKQGQQEIIRSNGTNWEVANKNAVVGPMDLVIAEGALYIVSLVDISTHLTNLSRMDLTTGKVEMLIPEYRLGIKNLKRLENGLLAMAETWNNRVLFFSPKTNEIVKELLINSGEPRDIAEIGHCLAVASGDARHVTFYDLNTYNEVAKWDLSSLGNKFRKPTKIGIDKKTGRLFARSTFICGPCTESMSSVIMAEESDQATFKACTK